jgi:hypothetical protein
MVTQATADEHVAAKQAEDEKKAAQAAEAQRLANERLAAAEITADPEPGVIKFIGSRNTDTDERVPIVWADTASATLPPPVPKIKNQGAELSEIQKNQREHTFNQLKDAWQQTLTPEERQIFKGSENFPGIRPFDESNIVPNDPLKLKFRGKLGIIQVEAASEEDQFKFLEFISQPENRLYLPGGRFELNGHGKMSTDDYMTAVKNEKIINGTPEQLALYSARDKVALLEGIPEKDRTTENIRDLGNAYEQEGDAILAEYEARNGSLPIGVSVSQGGVNLHGWTINKGDGAVPASYKDANGQDHTSQEILDNPELMQSFSDSIPQTTVDSFLAEVKANPDEVQSLVNLIGPTPEIYALLSKAHPELKDNGTIDEYFKLMRQRSGEGDLSATVQQVSETPVLLDGITPDPIAKPSNWQEFNKVWPDFINKLDEQYKSSATQNVTAWLTGTSTPDRVKNIGIDLLLSLTGASAVKMGFDTIANIFGLLTSVVTHLQYGTGLNVSDNETYQLWEAPHTIPTAEVRGRIGTPASPGEPYFGGAASLSMGSAPGQPQRQGMGKEEVWGWIIGAIPLDGLIGLLSKGNIAVLKASRELIHGVPEAEIIKSISVGSMERLGVGKTISTMDRETLDFILENEAALRAEAKQAGFDQWLAWSKKQAGEQFDRLNRIFAQKEILPKPEVIVSDAKKLVRNEIIKKLAPDEVKIPVTTEVKPGEPFDPKARYDIVDGVTVKTTEVPLVKAEAGQPLDHVDPLTKKGYTRAEPPTETAATAEKPVKPASGEKTTPAEGTTVPPEPVKPQGQAGEGQAAQPAAMSRDEITAQVKAQYPDATPEQITAAVNAKEAKMARTSPAMAELDTKISAARARIDERKAKGIGQRGAINDPEAAEYFTDHVELAKLYIQKGLKTVEEFAKELGVAVDDFIKRAWAEASAAKGESDQLKAALGISDDTHIPTGERVLSEADKAAAQADILTRLKAAREMLTERQAAVSELRGRQTAAGMEAKAAAGGGLKGYKAAGAAQQGAAEKVYTGLGEANFDEATVDYIINTPDRVYKENPAIFNKNRKGEYWTVRDAQDGLIKLMAGESLPEGQLKHLEKVYGIEFIKTVKNTPKGLMLDILAIPKSLMAFLDHSFPGRQGWIINSANPELFVKNIKDATGAFWSKDYLAALKQRVTSHPNFKISKAWGIEYTDTGMARVLREESYPSRIANKIPGMERSNESFTWAGNAQRLDAWNKYVKWLGADATDAELKGLAGFINKATGRGELGKATALAEELNTVIFSPKLFASRFQTPLMGITSAIPTNVGKRLGFAPYSKRLQSIYWRNVGASIGVTLTTLGLLKGLSELPGLKDKIYVETDLRSSDIGKVIIGDTHIDLTGGNGQLIYLLARMAAGTRKSGGSNEYDTTAAVELQRYLRYKGAPAASIVMDWSVGKDVQGEKFGTGKYWLSKIPFPMSIQDVYDAISISGLGGIATAPLIVYGVGVNTYEQRAMTEEKRLGALMYSDEQLMEATVKAKEKYTKPGANDPLGEKAVQTTLNKLAEDKYTLSDYRTYLRTAGVPDYKTTKLQEYFNECIPLFDKWQKDEAVTGHKETYTAAESAQAVFWGLDQTKGSSKTAAIAKLRQLGLSEEFAPWLSGKKTVKATPAAKPTAPSTSTGRRFIP